MALTENLGADEQPPTWMWHAPKALKQFLKGVQERRKNPSGDKNDDDDMYEGTKRDQLPAAWQRAAAANDAAKRAAGGR